MAFDWLGFMQLAEQLASDPQASSEASCRSAVSRAYYAVYHKTKSFVLSVDRDWSIQHSEIVRFFSEPRYRNRLREAFGRELKRLRDQRYTADYEAEIQDLPHFTRLAMDRPDAFSIRFPCWDSGAPRP